MLVLRDLDDNGADADRDDQGRSTDSDGFAGHAASYAPSHANADDAADTSQPAKVTPPAAPARPVTRKPVRPGKKPQTPLGLFPLEVVWRQPLAAPPSVWPAYDQTTAYIPLKTKALVAVSLTNGVARWTLDDVTVTAPPIADSNRLYLVGEGTLEARQTATGESIWRIPTTGEVSAPLVAQAGWLIVALDNGD